MFVMSRFCLMLLPALCLAPVVASAAVNDLQQKTQSQLQGDQSAPLFETPNQVSFQIGAQRNFLVRASGVPTPALSLSGGFLPAGLSFTAQDGGSAIIGGTPEPGTGGAGQIEITASNGAGTVFQNLSIFVGESAHFDGPLFAQFVAGQASSFTVAARGDSPMTVTVNGALPAGLVAADQGNGNAVISGTAAASSAGDHVLSVTASNALGSSTTALTINVANAQPLPGERNYSGMYYAPVNPGYAVNITHQGTTLVGAWYTYSQTGRPTWYLATAQRQPDGSFEGTYAVHTGVAFNLINNAQAFITSDVAGSARMVFDGNGDLDFRFKLNDDAVEHTRALTLFNFTASPSVCNFTQSSRIAATNYSDLWWQPSESGWGLTVTHQGNRIFAAWYTYLDDQLPIWMVSLLERGPDGSFSGPINRALSGVYYPFQGAGDVTTFPVPEVGMARLEFADGENAIFSYAVDGFTQSKAIERFVFGSPVQVCSHPAQ